MAYHIKIIVYINQKIKVEILSAARSSCKMRTMKWIRKRVAWVAGAAIGGFILWLIGTVVSLQATRAENAGKIFGHKVSFQTYQQALEAVTHQAILRYGEKAHQEAPQEELAHQAWERLILLSEAKRVGILVTDKEIVEELKKWPIFELKGQFDRAGYQTIVQYTLGTTPRVFEEEVREGLMIKKLFQKSIPEPHISEEELHTRFLQKETSIRVSTLILPDESLAREIAEAARQQPDQMSQAASQLGFKVILSDFFKEDTALPELGRAGLIFEPLFSLEPGQVTGPLPSSKGWIVSKLETKQPPDEKKFAEAKESLEKELIYRKRLEAYFNWYQDLLKRANLQKTLP